jgi:hypothetical protein
MVAVSALCSMEVSEHPGLEAFMGRLLDSLWVPHSTRWRPADKLASRYRWMTIPVAADHHIGSFIPSNLDCSLLDSFPLGCHAGPHIQWYTTPHG